jgi:hypothetical protein
MATEDKRIDQLDPVSVLDLTSLMAMQQGTNAKKVTLQQLLDYLNGQIGTGNAVLFVSQTLTDAQKLQARTNIGAAAPGEGGGSVEGAVLYTAQTLTEEQQSQARKNILCGSKGAVADNCVVSGRYSNVEGDSNKATGDFAHGEGYQNKASGNCSHVEGNQCEAQGGASHSEGVACKSIGQDAHAEGNTTVAEGLHSHSEGVGSYAKAKTSHAEGYWTVAASEAQHVQGQVNIEDADGKYAHIVGNGYMEGSLQEGTQVRFPSNAHTLDWNGVPWFAGDRVMLGGTGMDDEAAVALVPVFVPQELTEEQKAQARANIGVDAYIEQVFLGGEW